MLLACVALVLHALDLITGVRMIQLYGLESEQNPTARAIVQIGGPLGLACAKLGVVSTGIAFLVVVALAGRPRLARNALVVVAMFGILGFSSNLI
jgi:hypothetical protein